MAKDTSMHIFAVPLVCQDVLFFGAKDLHTEFLSPSYQGPIHLQESQVTLDTGTFTTSLI